MSIQALSDHVPITHQHVHEGLMGDLRNRLPPIQHLLALQYEQDSIYSVQKLLQDLEDMYAVNCFLYRTSLKQHNFFSLLPLLLWSAWRNTSTQFISILYYLFCIISMLCLHCLPFLGARKCERCLVTIIIRVELPIDILHASSGSDKNCIQECVSPIEGTYQLINTN